MNKSFILLATLGGLTLAACSSGGGSPSTPPAGSNKYVQIERLARPAVKELTERFVDHQITNAAEPYNDPTLQNSIQTFVNAFRSNGNGGTPNYGATVASILYPDEYAVDLSQSGKASYLGVETGGATGGKFGGRALTDDVIDISLGAVFGSTLSALGLAPDDGNENNCLTKQNVTQRSSQYQSGFPYLAAPH
ncbi:MAG: DUF4331 family protein [Vulcanimicrobiaceae bacterium]